MRLLTGLETQLQKFPHPSLMRLHRYHSVSLLFYFNLKEENRMSLFLANGLSYSCCWVSTKSSPVQKGRSSHRCRYFDAVGTFTDHNDNI